MASPEFFADLQTQLHSQTLALIVVTIIALKGAVGFVLAFRVFQAEGKWP